jgi:crotonobetainyl-CoA:carnitine CoA-transferase CaiB-like acyl-CoA transferase
MKIIELAGIGPCPMAAMLMADMGATVLRIERPEAPSLGIARPLRFNLLLRNRKAIALDLKSGPARDLLLRLIADADALIEGFRPGVMERLGLGPDPCLARNPRLVYGRMTGWGQTGPLAQVAGHDLNYVGLTGLLHAIGRAGQPPTPPLNVVGDFGGGALYLALGVLAAIIEARQSGQGQVVDAAIVDGTASLATALFGLHAAGLWDSQRGTNALDSGAYFYDVYECADGQWISVAPLEQKFHDKLLELLEIDRAALGRQSEREGWPRAREVLAERFKTKTQAQWCAVLGTADVCVAPVLSLDQAPRQPHLRERKVFVDIDGVVQPAPAPRFSRSVPDCPTAPEAADPATVDAALAPWLSSSERAQWRDVLAAGSTARHMA